MKNLKRIYILLSLVNLEFMLDSQKGRFGINWNILLQNYKLFNLSYNGTGILNLT